MARKSKKNGIPNEDSTKSVEGVNILTDSKYGVYVEGVEETIEMYEKGELTPEQLYESIMDLDIVYRSKPKNVESSGE
jgi:hypothetical protein